jgi:hypothetical protein
MSKKAYIIASGCFIVGILLGVVASTAYWGKQTVQGLALIKEMEIARYGERAFAAYQNESPQVAIYALSQYLDLLAEAEALAGDQAVFMTKNNINFDAMLAHARLAKVYSAAGQSDRSTEQVAKALERASRDQRRERITNETMLMETVAQVDEAATK